MKNLQILFIIFLINYICCDECTNAFKEEIIASCQSIDLNNEAKTCYYINDVCDTFDIYTTCEGYTDKNETICLAIKLRDRYTECQFDGEKCYTVKRNCTDYKDGDTCSLLFPKDDQTKTNMYCAKIGDSICEAQNNLCQGLDSTKCNSNIPLNPLHKCIYQHVGEEDLCSEVEDCEGYLGEDSTICESIIPLTSGEGAKSQDDTKKCIIQEVEGVKKCTKVPKTCSDYTTHCENYDSLVVTPNKVCGKVKVGDETQCKELFKTCEYYQQSDEGKNRTFCESIIPYTTSGDTVEDSSKCVFDSESKCIRVPKVCADIPKEECNLYELNSTTICLLENGICREGFKTCESYNTVVEVPENRINETCRKIVVITNNQLDYSKICYIKEVEGVNKCTQGAYTKCEEYEGQSIFSKEFCSGINLGVDKSGTRKCALIGNECKEQYKDCNSHSTEKIDKQTCESIVTSPYYKCVLEQDKTCTKKGILCSEYTGKDQKECEKYSPSDDEKYYCTIFDDQCIEQYKYCADYTGNDQTICESIIPYDEEGESELPNYKCIFDTNVGCLRQNKKCSDAKDPTDCELITPEDSVNKKCLFYNGQCVEEFRTCEIYSNNETVSGEYCENLKLKDNAKCKKGTNADGLVTCGDKTPKECSDLNLTSISYKCAGIQISKIDKKCVFSGTSCTEQSKTCLELTNDNKVTESICSSAATSNTDKVCSLKTDNSGCEETKKPDAPKTQNPSGETTDKIESPDSKSESGSGAGGEGGEGGEGGSGGNEDNNNSSEKELLSKLLIIMICLLY